MLDNISGVCESAKIAHPIRQLLRHLHAKTTVPFLTLSTSSPWRGIHVDNGVICCPQIRTCIQQDPGLSCRTRVLGSGFRSAHRSITGDEKITSEGQTRVVLMDVNCPIDVYTTPTNILRFVNGKTVLTCIEGEVATLSF